MYSAKILGSDSSNQLSLNQSNHRAAMNAAVKAKKQLPHGAKKK